MPRRVTASQGQGGNAARGRTSVHEAERHAALHPPVPAPFPGSCYAHAIHCGAGGFVVSVSCGPCYTQQSHRHAVRTRDRRRADVAAAASRPGRAGQVPVRREFPTPAKSRLRIALPRRLTEPAGHAARPVSFIISVIPMLLSPYDLATRGIWPGPSPSSVTTTGFSPNLPASM